VHTKSMDFGFYEQFCGGINLISFFFFFSGRLESDALEIDTGGWDTGLIFVSFGCEMEGLFFFFVCVCVFFVCRVYIYISYYLVIPYFCLIFWEEGFAFFVLSRLFISFAYIYLFFLLINTDTPPLTVPPFSCS